MIDLAGFWMEALQWLRQAVDRAWALQPFIPIVLVAPCVLALIYRSLTAFLLTVVLVGLAMHALRMSTEASYEWTIAAFTGVVGLLAVVQAVMLRRSRRRLRLKNGELEALQRERDEIREKHEREVSWRKAAEGLAAKKAVPVPSPAMPAQAPALPVQAPAIAPQAAPVPAAPPMPAPIRVTTSYDPPAKK